MKKEHRIPGLENFIDYLEKNLEGKVEASRPVRVGNTEKYLIYHNGKKYGIYTKGDRNGSEDDYVRLYYGKVPGCIGHHSNKGRIFLRYMNVKFSEVNKDSKIRSMKAERAEWKRYDDYPIVPFP